MSYFMACRTDLDLHEVLIRSGEIATISVESPGTQTSYARKEELPKELFL